MCVCYVDPYQKSALGSLGTEVKSFEVDNTSFEIQNAICQRSHPHNSGYARVSKDKFCASKDT